jgi:hypothetical protein
MEYVSPSKLTKEIDCALEFFSTTKIGYETMLVWPDAVVEV